MAKKPDPMWADADLVLAKIKRHTAKKPAGTIIVSREGISHQHHAPIVIQRRRHRPGAI
jgi:hypothetical protein